MARLISFVRQNPYPVLFACAFLYRVITALFYRQPGYTDAFYYTNVALQIWDGNGLRDDYIWNYLARPLPDNITGNPSNTYWMPLTSLLIAGGYLFTLGPSFFGSQIPGIILSSALAPLTFYLGRRVFNENGPAWLMGFLAVFCGFYAPAFSLPDNFAPYAFLSLLFLLECTSPRPRYWLFGFLAGLAYLTRVDGVLLLLVPPACLILQRYFFKEKSSFSWRGLPAMFLTFALIAGLWATRNALATGQLFPGGGLKVLFWREYNDFFSYSKTLDSGYYLNFNQPSSSWGIGLLLLSKLDALWQNLLLVARPAFIIFTPLAFLGFFTRLQPDAPPAISFSKPGTFWRRPEILPFSVYALGLYLSMSLLFTFPSTRGSVFHSAGGLLPFVFAALLSGLYAATGLLGRLSRPKAYRSRVRFFSGLVLAVAVFFSIGWTLAQSSSWDSDYNELKAVSQWFDQNAPGAIAMLPDPTAYWYVSRKPSISIAADTIAANLELAHRYRAEYMVLQPLQVPELLLLYMRNEAPGFQFVTTIGTSRIYRVV